MKCFLALAVLAAGLVTGAAAPASADPLAAVQAFTLNDVRSAEAIYAANPTVPTYKAATSCLNWLDATLSTLPAGATINLAPPQGVASTIADLDVALNSGSNAVPAILYEFNNACGAYVEDLKAQAAALAGRQAAGGLLGFLHL